MYYVYILYSGKFDRYYIGQTQDLQGRLIRHNAKLEKATAPYVLSPPENFKIPL